MNEREQLKQALEAAVDDVNNQGDEPHKRMMASPAVPGWLTNILQLLGPPMLDAVRQWIDKAAPSKGAKPK